MIKIKQLVITLILITLALPAIADLCGRDGTYVGMFRYGEDRIFLKINLKHENGEPGVDVDIPMWGVEDYKSENIYCIDNKISFTVNTGEQKIHFDAKAGFDSIKGKTTVNNVEGEFLLRYVNGICMDSYRKYIGNYRLGKNKLLLVGVSWGKFRYYIDDYYVLMYPLNPRQFLSETGELLSFNIDKNDDVSSVTIVGQTGFAREALRENLYTEEQVIIKNKDVELRGSLLIPKNSEAHPAVVMVHGSGAQDREPYRIIADKFAKNGISVLMYDKRGAGESSGNWETASIQELADDALAAVGSLKARGDIDSTKIGLYGGSQAGWIIPYAAARSKDISFIMITAGPAISPAEQDIYRINNLLKEKDLPDELITKADKLLRYFYNYVIENKNEHELDELIKELENDKRLSYLTWKISKGINNEFYKKFGFNYDPVPDFQKITVPVLCIWGELDKIVPAQGSRSIIDKALAQAGNMDYTLKIFPQANHVMRLAETGGYAEWDKLREYVPGYLDFQLNWLLSRVEKRNQ